MIKVKEESKQGKLDLVLKLILLVLLLISLMNQIKCWEINNERVLLNSKLKEQSYRLEQYLDSL